MYCEMRSTPSVVISPLLQVALPRETGLPSPGKRRCRRGWAGGGHHDKRLSKRQLFILTFILCNHNPLLGKKELRAFGKKREKAIVLTATGWGNCGLEKQIDRYLSLDSLGTCPLDLCESCLSCSVCLLFKTTGTTITTFFDSS